LYQKGLGVKQNTKKAEALLKQAAFAASSFAGTVIAGNQANVFNNIWLPECLVAINHHRLGGSFQHWLNMLTPENC